MSLTIYKRGQGYHTRLWSALSAFLLVAIGCYRLHLKLYSPDKFLICIGIPVAICAGLAFLIYWLVNKPNIADFLIAAEGEVKKVSWANRRELVASTTIVIGVVLCMGFMLVGVDFVFRWLFEYVIKIY